MISRLALICVLYIFLFQGALSKGCSTCMQSNLFVELTETDSTLAKLDHVIHVTNQLCNMSFETQFERKACFLRGEQYAKDVIRDHLSDNHKGAGSVLIKLPALCEVLAICTVTCCNSQWNPEQVHIAVGGNYSEMTIMFTTQSELSSPSVAYWPQLPPGQTPSTNNILLVNGSRTTYDLTAWTGNIYTTTLTNLHANTTYFYRLGGSEGEKFVWFGEQYNFTTDAVPSVEMFPPRIVGNQITPFNQGNSAPVICLFGDMGDEEDGAECSQGLVTLAQNQSIQAIAHVGDIAYADGTVSIWDKYLRMIEGYASIIPVMTAPGNHENYDLFDSYYHRFTMPTNQSSSDSRQYYSFNYGKIHFVSFSVEEADGIGLLPGGPQRAWLENDLAQANTERDIRPWVVLFGHRPLYCSTDSSDCSTVAPHLRDLLEDLINQYHVDVVVGAHKHNYERTYPVYQSNVAQKNYNDPFAPVYYVAGTGGRGKDNSWVKKTPIWSADRDDTLGYLMMSAPDQYSLQMYYVSKSFNTHDSATIVRSSSITNWTFTH